MSAAAQVVPAETEPLPWVEICARYPDQLVCLVDVVRAELRSPEILSARVVGHGFTHDAAFDPIRDDPEKHPPMHHQVHWPLHRTANSAVAGHR